MLNRDLSWYRGDKTDFSFVVNGNHTERYLRFVVKADKEITSNRLIEKRNQLFGGSDTQLFAEYNEDTNRTTITIHILGNDNSDFKNAKYYYDVVSINPTDLDDTVTIIKGTITNNIDVQTDFDGTDLPGEAQRYMPVIADNFDDQELIKTQVVNGVKTFIGSGIFASMFQADENGDIMPIDDGPLPSAYFELDENEDLQPRN